MLNGKNDKSDLSFVLCFVWETFNTENDGRVLDIRQTAGEVGGVLLGYLAGRTFMYYRGPALSNSPIISLVFLPDKNTGGL